MRDKLRSNPVRAAGGLTAAITAFLGELVAWGVTVVPAWVPGEVVSTARPLGFAVAIIIGERIGRAVQKRWTMPTPGSGHV